MIQSPRPHPNKYNFFFCESIFGYRGFISSVITILKNYSSLTARSTTNISKVPNVTFSVFSFQIYHLLLFASQECLGKHDFGVTKRRKGFEEGIGIQGSRMRTRLTQTFESLWCLYGPALSLLGGPTNLAFSRGSIVQCSLPRERSLSRAQTQITATFTGPKLRENPLSHFLRNYSR